MGKEAVILSVIDPNNGYCPHQNRELVALIIKMQFHRNMVELFWMRPIQQYLFFLHLSFQIDV
jgi:hypothetical protein